MRFHDAFEREIRGPIDPLRPGSHLQAIENRLSIGAASAS
jgi:hypothetical protein